MINIAGQLNEYGLLKDAARKKLEGVAGLDTNADFDEYTIYDQGEWWEMCYLYMTST